MKKFDGKSKPALQTELNEAKSNRKKSIICTMGVLPHTANLEQQPWLLIINIIHKSVLGMPTIPAPVDCKFLIILVCSTMFISFYTALARTRFKEDS